MTLNQPVAMKKLLLISTTMWPLYAVDQSEFSLTLGTVDTTDWIKVKEIASNRSAIIWRGDLSVLRFVGLIAEFKRLKYTTGGRPLNTRLHRNFMQK